MRFPGMRLVEQIEQKKTELLQVSLKNTTDCNSQAVLIIKAPTKNTTECHYNSVLKKVWGLKTTKKTKLWGDRFLKKVEECRKQTTECVSRNMLFQAT